MVLIRFDSLFFFFFFPLLSVGRPKIQIFRATRFFSPTETTDFLSLPTDSTLFTMNNNNNDNKISTTDNNTNTTDNNTASATSVHFDLTEEETDYDDDDEEEEEEEEEEVQEVDYDDLLLQYALNESFETEQPVNPPHLLKISPIVVPDHVSSVTVFCCACMEHYPQHEMHLFKNCPHGLCKHRCAAMYTSPFCPECKASLIEEEEEEEEDTEEQDTEEQTELKRMVDYTISQILKEIAEQEQQQQEEEEGRRKRTKIH